VGRVRDPGAITRLAVLAVVLASAACTTAQSQAQSPPAGPSTPSPVAHPVVTKLQQQMERFVHLHSAANPNAVVVLTSSRTLQPGHQGLVLTVRSVGNLIGSCSPGRPAVKFRISYRGAGPPVVTKIRQALATPAGLGLLGGAPAPSPIGGKQQFAFLQVVSGGEAADFSLALWATLTPVAGGCAFSANGVLRVRCTAFANQICSYIARRGAWTHLG
jgi:hypothetical protein